MEGIYCGITFGNKKDWDKGRFVIVGYEKGKATLYLYFQKMVLNGIKAIK